MHEEEALVLATIDEIKLKLVGCFDQIPQLLPSTRVAENVSAQDEQPSNAPQRAQRK